MGSFLSRKRTLYLLVLLFFHNRRCHSKPVTANQQTSWILAFKRVKPTIIFSAFLFSGGPRGASRAGLLLKVLPVALRVQLSSPRLGTANPSEHRLCRHRSTLVVRGQKNQILLGVCEDQALPPWGPAAGRARAALPSGPLQRAGHGGDAPAGLGLRTSGCAPAPGPSGRPAPLPHGRARLLQLLPGRAPHPYAAVPPHQLRPCFLWGLPAER